MHTSTLQKLQTLPTRFRGLLCQGLQGNLLGLERGLSLCGFRSKVAFRGITESQPASVMSGVGTERCSSTCFKVGKVSTAQRHPKTQYQAAMAGLLWETVLKTNCRLLNARGLRSCIPAGVVSCSTGCDEANTPTYLHGIRAHSWAIP